VVGAMLLRLIRRLRSGKTAIQNSSFEIFFEKRFSYFNYIEMGNCNFQEMLAFLESIFDIKENPHSYIDCIKWG
jgi:hypothetical protein